MLATVGGSVALLALTAAPAFAVAKPHVATVNRAALAAHIRILEANAVDADQDEEAAIEGQLDAEQAELDAADNNVDDGQQGQVDEPNKTDGQHAQVDEGQQGDQSEQTGDHQDGAQNDGQHDQNDEQSGQHDDGEQGGGSGGNGGG